MNRWDRYFFDLCRLNAAMSKDNSTTVGAVVVRPNRTVAAMGWNGFPRGTRDDADMIADRPTKYARTVHAELNAILSAAEPVKGCTIYVAPLHPCAACAAAIIQAGIRRVVALMPDEPDRWRESFAHAQAMFAEAGVFVEIHKGTSDETGD